MTAAPWDGVAYRTGSGEAAGARRCCADTDDAWAAMNAARKKRE
jgi:hypothetical protein